MDVPILRILTEKSKLNFGKYSDLMVIDIMNLWKNKYLRWVYYNCSNISFIPEILDKLLIFESYRIEKPGTNRELGQRLDLSIYSNTSEINRMKNSSHSMKVYKAKLVQKNIVENKRFSKANLQRKNHGK